MEIEVEKFGEMLSGSLNIKEPWYISKVEFEKEKMTAHIFVEVRKGIAICCPLCGGETKRFGYEKKERKWRHADCLFYPSYIHCRRPKVRCDSCGVQQISAPYERKNSRFTLLFEGYAMMIVPDMPVSKAARLLRCDEKSLHNIMEYWVNKAVEKLNFTNVTSLAIDETSFKKGHKYVTLIIDANTRTVIDVQEGKDKQTIYNFAKTLEEKQGSCDKIESITSDMSTSFLPAIEEKFPKAESVVDKFHVKQLFHKALDKVRKDEQKVVGDKKTLFQGRRLFMIPESKMTDEQKNKLLVMSKNYPKTGKAYQIIAALDDFYACESIEDAQICFKKLFSWMRRCRLEPMKKVAETFLKHKNKIMAYFTNRLTNAICEGINSLVQTAKRKARGFHTFESYKTMIFLVAGKLNLQVPIPF